MAISDLDLAREIKQEDAANQSHTQDLLALRDTLENYGKTNLSLLIVTFILLCFGLIMLFSASLSSAYASWGDPLYFVKRQLIFTVIGLVFIYFFIKVPIRFFNRFIFTVSLYGLVTLLLALVRLKGVTGDYGAVRWLTIGPIQFQPSEMAKVAAIFCLASYFPYVEKLRRRGAFQADDARQQLLKEGRIFISYPIAAMGLWFFLIAIQPHLSGAIIFFFLVASMFLVARIPGRLWLAGLVQLLPVFLIIGMLALLLFPLFNDGEGILDFVQKRFAHVFSRLETFNNPDEASQDNLLQVRQSRYALGSGGLLGKGLGMGQQKSGFLPMVYNDFILPAVGEELGFVGTFLILFLFLFFFFTGVQITLNSNSQYAALMAWGSTFLITIQALMNMAVMAEIFPPTGISLPFFSYGGSSHIFFLIAVGFLLSVSKSGQKVDPQLKQILLRDQAYRKLLSGSARKRAHGSNVESSL